MRSLIIIFFVILFSCNRKNNNQLELEILNQNILSLKNDKIIDIHRKILDSNLINKSKTIITYKLTNYSNNTYYFNMNLNSNFQNRFDGISIKNGYLCFYDDNNLNLKTNSYRMNLILNGNDYLSRNIKISKFLDYSEDFNSPYIQEQLNFIIHSNETIYFEWFVNLPYGNEIQNSYLNLDINKKYSAEIIMYSDSTNYKKYLSRTTLKTIKDNNYKIFHGIIKSKNKVPIKVIE